MGILQMAKLGHMGPTQRIPDLAQKRDAAMPHCEERLDRVWRALESAATHGGPECSPMLAALGGPQHTGLSPKKADGGIILARLYIAPFVKGVDITSESTCCPNLLSPAHKWSHYLCREAGPWLGRSGTSGYRFDIAVSPDSPG